MRISKNCYKKLRLTVANTITRCLLYNDLTKVYLSSLICKPIVLDDSIRILLNVPALSLLGQVNSIKLCASDLWLLSVDLDATKLSKTMGSVLNIKFKFGE